MPTLSVIFTCMPHLIVWSGRSVLVANEERKMWALSRVSLRAKATAQRNTRIHRSRPHHHRIWNIHYSGQIDEHLIPPVHG